MTIRRPLAGMLVLDLGQIYNGPYAGLNLGFMGARVLKIEPPEGDVVRRRKREVEPYPLVMLNSNKESVVLDLKQPRGKEIFLALVAKADVVIENFAAGVMDRLGLGYDVLSKLNPRLVYGGSSGFGLDGPYRDLAAMAHVAQHVAKCLRIAGHFEADIEAFGHAQVLLHIRQRVLAGIHGHRHAHLLRQVETPFVDVRNHHETRAGVAHNLSSVATICSESSRRGYFPPRK